MTYSIAMQVLAYVLVEGPKKSWDLRRAIMGPRYAEASKNNNNYNRHRKAAVSDDIIVKEGDFYSLGVKGNELIAWALKEDIDLSIVKTEQRIKWEEANKEVCEKCPHGDVNHTHATIEA